MVDMKLTPTEQKEYSDYAAIEKPQYPYGLRLSLNDEVIEKLGIAALPQVCQKMTLTATVEVCCVSQYDSADSDGPTKSMDLQIVAMELGPEKVERDAAKSLYGGQS